MLPRLSPPNLYIQNKMALILLIGTLAATFLVFIGGMIFLYFHGNDILQLKLFESSHYKIDTLHLQFSYSPSFLIELGLLALVATQILRVLLLVFYYTKIRDYKFSFISLFVLLVLIFSLLAQ